jgi:hypothetical protein
MLTGFMIFEAKTIRLSGLHVWIRLQFSSMDGFGKIGSPGGALLSHTIDGLFVCFLSGSSDLEDSDTDERLKRKDTITSSHPSRNQ